MFRRRTDSFNRTMFAGMACFALAGSWRMFATHYHLLSPNLEDAGMGLFNGLAFALMLLGLRRRGAAASGCVGSSNDS